MLRRRDDGCDHVADHVGLFSILESLGVSAESVKTGQILCSEQRKRTDVLVEAKTSGPSGSERSTSALERSIRVVPCAKRIDLPVNRTSIQRRHEIVHAVEILDGILRQDKSISKGTISWNVTHLQGGSPWLLPVLPHIMVYRLSLDAIGDDEGGICELRHGGLCEGIACMLIRLKPRDSRLYIPR